MSTRAWSWPDCESVQNKSGTPQLLSLPTIDHVGVQHSNVASATGCTFLAYTCTHCYYAAQQPVKIQRNQFGT